jgi:hypothetical protein
MPPRPVNLRTAPRSNIVHRGFVVKANGNGQDRRTYCNKGSRGALETTKPVNCGVCLREKASPKWAWLEAPPATTTTQLHEGGHVRH